MPLKTIFLLVAVIVFASCQEVPTVINESPFYIQHLRITFPELESHTVRGPHGKFLDELKTELHLLNDLTKTELTTLHEKLNQQLKQTREVIKSKIIERMKENERREEQNLHALVTLWKQIWNLLNSGVKAAIDTAKNQLAAGKKKIDDLLNKMETIVHELPSEWKTTTTQLKDRVVTMEQNFMREVNRLEKRFERLLKHAEKQPLHESLFKHGFMKCGECGKVYTFDEFLDIYAGDQHLALPEQEHWSEGDVEEFYEGWAVWANYLKLKCTKCGSSKWTDVVTHDDAPTISMKKKDEL